MTKKELIAIGFQHVIGINTITKIIKKHLNLDTKGFLSLEKINDNEVKKIIGDFERLKNKVPLEYVLKKAEFYGHDFYVDDRVLIPRNETELLVGEVIGEFLEMINERGVLVDVGTGSGCIPISVLKSGCVFDEVYTIDVSEDALDVAKINIKNHDLEDKIKLINSDLLSDNSFLTSNNSFLLITANLPYIKDGDNKNMDEGVIINEPDKALYGGENTGFELYEELIDQIFAIKKEKNIKNIVCFFEIGYNQREIAKKYLKDKKCNFEFIKDINEIDRILKIIMNCEL